MLRTGRAECCLKPAATARTRALSKNRPSGARRPAGDPLAPVACHRALRMRLKKAPQLLRARSSPNEEGRRGWLHVTLPEHSLFGIFVDVLPIGEVHFHPRK